MSGKGSIEPSALASVDIRPFEIERQTEVRAQRQRQCGQWRAQRKLLRPEMDLVGLTPERAIGDGVKVCGGRQLKGAAGLKKIDQFVCRLAWRVVTISTTIRPMPWLR